MHHNPNSEALEDHFLRFDKEIRNLKSEGVTQMKWASLVICCCHFFQSIVWWSQQSKPSLLMGVMSTIATQLWLEKLQNKPFNKIVSMDISWFDRSGNSPNECREVTGDKVAQVFIFMLSLLFSFGYSFFISSSVTLTNLPILLIFIIINCLRMKSRDADALSASLTTRSTKVATEYVQNFKTIQILNCQKFVINDYQDMLVHAKKEAMISLIWYAANGFSKALIQWSMGILFIYGANIIASGNVQGTSLIGVVSVLSLASMLAGPVLILTSQYPAARQAIKRLNRIAYTKTSLNTLTDQGIKPEISGNIVFQDVMFSYPTREKVQIIKKFNLEIQAGNTVALVGDSGYCKSTIISFLESFSSVRKIELPNGGKILIDSNDINDINVRYLRSQMGLVSQEPVLFDMTIKENILYGLEEEVIMDKIIKAATNSKYSQLYNEASTGFDTLLGERGSKLSGGQKQGIIIARAVLRNPKILLQDEVTSALDSQNEMEALENVSIGWMNIVVAHRLSTIYKADKIVVLQPGLVIEEGDDEQLIEKRGHYFHLLNK